MSKIKLSDNVHPNLDGSPWGWIVYENAPRVRIATYSSRDEKEMCRKIVEVYNNQIDGKSKENTNL